MKISIIKDREPTNKTQTQISQYNAARNFQQAKRLLIFLLPIAHPYNYYDLSTSSYILRSIEISIDPNR